MAPDSMNTLHLRIDLDATLTLARLAKAEELFAGLLREVSADFTGRGPDAVRWVVSSITASSVDIAVSPSPSSVDIAPSSMDELVQVVNVGLKTLSERPQRPAYFNDRALQKTEELANLRLSRMKVRNGSYETPVTLRMAANAEEILGQETVSYGTVEGRLEVVNLHMRRRFHVYDLLTGESVPCDFGDRIALDDIRRSIYRRVAVEGEIAYRSNGTIARMRADRLHTFPEDSDLPTVADVAGILRDT